MNKQQRKIVEGLANKARILLDEYLTAKRQYDYFIYTVKNESVTQRFHNSYGAHIFYLINGTLLEDLIKKIYNVVYDSDDRSVSVVNLIEKTKTHRALLEEHASIVTPVNVSFGDGIPEEDQDKLKADFEKEDAQDSLVRFKSVYKKYHDAFDEFSKYEPLSKWKEIRHKVVSHVDARKVRGELKRTHLSDFGLKYDDLADFIQKVENLIDLTDGCCASASYSYDMANDHNILYTKDFWERVCVGTRYRGGVKINRRKRESCSFALRNYLK
ncbi:MAG: hypothetical protein JEY79_12425 [Pseudodesulfovibrio sp.]|nr:hypothetical protein [Pseudodesulfovibrio sp.]